MAAECEREVRKRRERRDSGCTHERKERRPHSEERAPPPPPAPPLHDYNYLESERRAERLSRARRPQFCGKRRRQQPRPTKQYFYKTKENECLLNEEERPDTPIQTDCGIQRAQFYEQVQQSEGIELAANRLTNEPTRSHAAELPRASEPLDIELRRSHTDYERRYNKICKKISVIKKHITKYESEFEAKHGYKMSPTERITDVHLTRTYETLRRLQAEKRCIKTDPVEYAIQLQAAKLQKERDEKLDIELKSDKPMVELVKDIEEWLEGCRNAAGRSLASEASWGSSQLAAEKAAVQRALLRLEAARGRPVARSVERGVARPLYERYRAVKRRLAGEKGDAVNNTELATILEHETMLFHCSVDSSSDSQEKPNNDDSQLYFSLSLHSLQEATPATVDPPSPASSVRSSSEPSNEGLHCLGVDELRRALNEAKLHKCLLRRTLKEYEVSFEAQNRRKLQRDDKKGNEDEYLKYKAIKARIKLLNALINKQKTVP